MTVTTARPLHKLVNQTIVSFVADETGSVLRCDGGATIRINTPMKLTPKPSTPTSLIGERITSVFADEEVLTMVIGPICLSVNVNDLEPGANECVIITTMDLIIVWP